MDYNAIVREKNDEIFGKILLKDLKNLPADWYVTYNQRVIRKDTDLKTLLCDRQFPLSIHKSVVGQVKVKTLTDERFVIIADKNNTIEELKTKIEHKEGTPSYKQRLIFAGKQMEDGRTLGDYGWETGSILHLVFGLRGGGGFGPTFSAVNLESEHVKGQGVKANAVWQCYRYGYDVGLNAKGTCTNKSCLTFLRNAATYSHESYGDRVLDVGSNRFKCCVCKENFIPTNFIVSSARSLFRFRKAGCFEIQSTLLESFGGIGNFSMFDPKAKNADYDLIEIKTVRENESPYSCLLCDKMIRQRNDAVLCDCLHSVHRQCTVKQGCQICNAKLMTIKEVEAIIRNYKGNENRAINDQFVPLDIDQFLQ